MVEKSKELKEKEQKILSNKTQSIYALALLIGFCIVINIIFSFVNFKIDLTEEKRFTLTPSTVQMLNGLKDNIYVEVLLEGQFPAGFKLNCLNGIMLHYCQVIRSILSSKI